MSTPSQEQTGKRFADSLNSAVRENPVSAGLLGLGVMWMILGSERIGSLPKLLSGTGRVVSDSIGEASEKVSTLSGAAATKIGEVVSEASETIRSEAEDIVGKVKSAEGNGSRALTGIGRDVGRSIQENVASTLDRQPLLLALAGIGIGAGIASMFASTAVERELAGAAALKVREKLSDMGTEATRRVEDVIEGVKREANAQGITTSTASDSIKSVADKLIATGAVAKESLGVKPS